MLHISEEEIYESLALENPWWTTGKLTDRVATFPERAYLPNFQSLVFSDEPIRSVILLGPRRVGKTVMILQTIGELLRRGVSPEHIFYISLDRPLYNAASLEKLVRVYLGRVNHTGANKFYFFFDEIQYVSDWERELKSLTDLFPKYKFVVSGSAAAALRVKSHESGAGRFTDFLLPPLTFDEFLKFQNERNESLDRLNRYAEEGFADHEGIRDIDIAFINILFERYLAYGGYPEAVFSVQVQRNLDRFVREDIVEKVLLRDLPGLYGIQDTRELNSLFSTLCYNTAQEISLEGLSQSSSISKNTIKRYLEYLEAAFLVRTINRIDQNAARFRRQTFFKTYLANPSLRAALFRPISQDDEGFGPLAETAVFSQWFHSPSAAPFYYARWDKGEVDLVDLDAVDMQPDWCVEIKWSDRHLTRLSELSGVTEFLRRHKSTMNACLVTSRSKFGSHQIAGLDVSVIPTALYCWQVGRNSVAARTQQGELPFTLEEYEDED